MMIFTTGEPDGRKDTICFFTKLRVRQVLGAVNQRQLGVLARRGARQQIEILKNESNFAIADLGELIAIQP